MCYSFFVTYLKLLNNTYNGSFGYLTLIYQAKQGKWKPKDNAECMYVNIS